MIDLHNNHSYLTTYPTKQKKKPGKPVKEKTRKKGSILSIQDKEKAKKFLNKFKKSN